MEDSLGGKDDLHLYIKAFVLILVVVEDSLGEVEKYKFLLKRGVLILVVVEDSLGAILQQPLQVAVIGLNPCCCGR